MDKNSTLCEKGEDVYISCAFNSSLDQDNYLGKVASICAKNNTSPDSGYVQYRFGKPSYGVGPARIELQYPEQKIPPKGIFLKVPGSLFALHVANTFIHSKALTPSATTLLPENKTKKFLIKTVTFLG